MVSRMEKYYKNTTDSNKRSQKNRELYRDIYIDSEYSNIEGVATMSKNNEVDITKIKNTIKNRENYKKQRQFRQISENNNKYHEIEENEQEISKEFTSKEQKNYDIRDILTKAKDKKPLEDTPRSLDNTNYNILKNLKLNNNKDLYKDKHKDFEDDELKELINTITNTSMLNQMNDKELGLNMFNLESEDNTELDGSASIRQLLEQAKEYEDEKKSSLPEIDDSFYTSSLNLSKEDFEIADEFVSKRKTKKILKKILLIMGFLVITGLVIFGVYLLIK